jgi:hypothetical protein
MRGKIVNLCIGVMNLLFGALIIFFTIYVPQDKTLLTVQENYVVGYITKAIYLVMLFVVIIDAVQSYNHRTDTTFNTGYIIGIFSISFIFIKEPIIAAFSIVSGIIILFKSIKENLVEINSTTGISVSIVVMAAIAIIAIVSLSYASIGESIKNKENKNELSYTKDYFKYITELDEKYQEPYINVKKDGKFGYINSKGETVIDFKYDYASPFVQITEYDKNFYIALVCENGSSYIILKNGRTVMSYRSESSDENYGAKLEELEDIYHNTLSQIGSLKYEITEVDNNINKVSVYQEISSDYTYRYNYNDEYDLIVTQSNLGLGDKYELAKKDNLDVRIALDTTDLDYDSSYLYLFSDGTIPFYEMSKRNQGWYTSYGMKYSMSGKAQILDFFGERILLKNYNDNTIYFIDSNRNMVSDAYKDIYVCNNGRYIVRDKDEYLRIIDDSYNSVFEKKYAVINPRLITENIYLVLDSTEDIKFNDYGYAILNWSIMNYDGEIIFDGIEQIYDNYYEYPDTKGKSSEKYAEFVENLKDLKYKFVGDKFYLDYK